jgi:hypothetical protein
MFNSPVSQKFVNEMKVEPFESRKLPTAHEHLALNEKSKQQIACSDVGA